jgi:predicted DCC family thiol-disulfide oxidoreductase YuxK
MVNSASTSISEELHCPVLLYDGDCGFCAHSVAFILRHERRHSLLFAALQGPLGTQIRGRHPELGVDSMVWVDPPQSNQEAQILARSAAALRVASYLGGPWRLAALGRLLPISLRDAAYDWIARHRHGLARGGAQCFLPSADVRSRFLDRELTTTGSAPAPSLPRTL